MKFGQALEAVSEERGENQYVVASIACVSNSLVSKIVRGTRKAPSDLIRSTVAHYDEPRLYLAAQEEVAGDATVPWLNNSDLHPSTVHLKNIEEIREAIEAMSAVPITKRKDRLTDADRAAIKKAIKESIEAITALTHYVAILCKEYGFSWMAVWKEHRLKLKTSKYIK